VRRGTLILIIFLLLMIAVAGIYQVVAARGTRDEPTPGVSTPSSTAGKT
jgi:hypothetical protein